MLLYKRLKIKKVFKNKSFFVKKWFQTPMDGHFLSLSLIFWKKHAFFKIKNHKKTNY